VKFEKDTRKDYFVDSWKKSGWNDKEEETSKELVTCTEDMFEAFGAEELW